MKKEEKATQQLAAIQSELVAMFGEFCRQSATPELATLMQHFTQHRVSLVFTVSASMNETGLFCGFIDANAPGELRQLFSVQAPAPGAHVGALH
jgi:hypothetical protein